MKKQVVHLLKEVDYFEVDYHVVRNRPRGSYQSVIRSKNFQVKNIVKPGKSLSLQSHEHHSEHWVVVEAAEVINEQETLFLEANQLTYVSLGVKHRLRNLVQDELVKIDVQTGY
jgi:mannose-1-phosphate guanylyltransferase/mannose-6-phosphate isomerase